MPSPQNLAELQTFMGMINYLNWFFSIMAQTLEPLRQLMRNTNPFNGNEIITERFKVSNK